jgi:hypothetical protein
MAAANRQGRRKRFFLLLKRVLTFSNAVKTAQLIIVREQQQSARALPTKPPLPSPTPTAPHPQPQT